MSFNWYARKVLNPVLRLSVRGSALRSCILRLCRLTGERYTHALTRYSDTRGIDFSSATEQELVTALARIQSERNQFLEQVRAFERKRVREKLRGKRRPSKADVVAFHELQDPTAMAPRQARPSQEVPRKNYWSKEQWQRFAVSLLGSGGVFFLGAIIVLTFRFLGVIRPEEQSWVIPLFAGGSGLILGTIILFFKGR